MESNPEIKILNLEFIMACMFNLDHIMAYASTRLRPEHITTDLVGGTAAHRFVYAEMVGHWERFDERPGSEALVALLKASLIHTKTSGFTPVGDLAEQVFRVYYQISSSFDVNQSVKLAIENINRYYEHLVSRPQIQASLAEAMDGEKIDAGSLTNSILSATSLLGGARQPSPVFSFEAVSDPSVIPAGISWVNKLLAGGYRRGQGYGLVVPTGGGKTTFAGQQAFAVANQGIPAAVVYTEQTMKEPEMVARFWTLVTGKPYDEYLKRLRSGDIPTRDELTETEKSTFDTVSNSMQIYDFSIQRGSISELRSIAMGHMGQRKPEILIVDWAEQFAKNLLATDPNLRNENRTTAIQYVADECALIAREAEIPVLVFQMMGGSAGNSPMKRYTHKDASYCKNFCDNLAYGIVIPPRDDNDITRFEVTKGRYITGNSQIVKLEGALGRFVEMKNYKQGRYKYEREGRREDEMPDVRRSKQQGGFSMEFENPDA